MVVYLLQEVKCQKQRFCPNILNIIDFLTKAVIIEYIALTVLYQTGYLTSHIAQLFWKYDCLNLQCYFLTHFHEYLKKC